MILKRDPDKKNQKQPTKKTNTNKKNCHIHRLHPLLIPSWGTFCPMPNFPKLGKFDSPKVTKVESRRGGAFTSFKAIFLGKGKRPRGNLRFFQKRDPFFQKENGWLIGDCLFFFEMFFLLGLVGGTGLGVVFSPPYTYSFEGFSSRPSILRKTCF